MRITLSLFLTGLLALTALAQNKKPTSTKWDQMDVGPFFTSGLEGRQRIQKNISIRVGDQQQATVAFDTEMLRLAYGWSGGFLKLPVGRDGLEGFPQVVGTLAFHSPAGPGISLSNHFTDPRPKAYGSLPKDIARYRGLYLHGKQTILSYDVGESEILEMPGFEDKDGLSFFTRTFHYSGKTPFALAVLEGKGQGTVFSDSVIFEEGDSIAIAHVVGREGEWRIKENKAYLFLGKGKRSGEFQIRIWSGNKDQKAAALSRFQQRSDVPNIAKLTRGGPARWTQVVETKGSLGTNDGPYVVDTITVPEENPYKSWIRCSGFDFFKDGRAAICSVSGDVWIVSGIDEDLTKLTWKRYATGLFQPLGLKVVKDKVYVLGRDQITRLHDHNEDGEADFYENFNNDVTITQQYHEFCLNLETDSEGNFYFTKGGNLGQAEIPHHGCLLKVSADGETLEVVATGLRAPNGLGMGPNNEITTSDNEGNWVPASRINLTKKGGFYGHVFTAHRNPPPTDYDKPLFWLPHDVDNSSGGQVWVTSDKWGPFKGDMLHLSYGASSMFKVMMDKVGDQTQGAVYKFPLKFQTGVMRGRFSKLDGQLYLCGLVVWQSNGPRQGAFHRVRYTGKPVYAPKDFKLKPNGIELTFTQPLDKATAADPQNFGIDQWNYQWTEKYGSKEYSVVDPNKIGHDSVEIKSIQLRPDGKSLFLEIPGIKPVMQMRVKLAVKAADGTPINTTIFNTINEVPGVATSNLSAK